MPQFSYFKFRIKDHRYQIYKKFGAFIFLLNGVAFLYLSNGPVAPFTHLLFIVLGVIMVLYAAYAFFSRATDRVYITLYSLAALTWISELGFLTPAAVLIVLMILQILSHYKIFLIIDKDGVTLMNYSLKFYPWSEIKNLVMKDGLITIDLPEHKTLQLEPDFARPLTIQKGGSLNMVTWHVNEDYTHLQDSVNSFYQQKQSTPS